MWQSCGAGMVAQNKRFSHLTCNLSTSRGHQTCNLTTSESTEVVTCAQIPVDPSMVDRNWSTLTIRQKMNNYIHSRVHTVRNETSGLCNLSTSHLAKLAARSVRESVEVQDLSGQNGRPKMAMEGLQHVLGFWPLAWRASSSPQICIGLHSMLAVPHQATQICTSDLV